MSFRSGQQAARKCSPKLKEWPKTSTQRSLGRLGGPGGKDMVVGIASHWLPVLLPAIQKGKDLGHMGNHAHSKDMNDQTHVLPHCLCCLSQLLVLDRALVCSGHPSGFHRSLWVVKNLSFGERR